MSSENGSANGSAHLHSHSDHAQNLSTPTSTSRNPLSEAASLISRGGLGHAYNTRSQASSSPTRSTPQPTHSSAQSSDVLYALDTFEKQFYPGQPKSLSGIALRSFILGATLTSFSTLTLYLLYFSHSIWRAPFFLTTLSLFHFLEFYTTSLTNTSSAQISSFLLSSNGSAYTIAHTCSLLETLLSHYVHPRPLLPPLAHTTLLTLGLSLIILGQTVRATAMLTAGTNFSHIVRARKSPTHTLVTSGIYSIFRHPSYFGFFWWGIGTQLVCGNAVCLVGYAVVLWKFFERRIEGEEELLVRFFGVEYESYRKRTMVGIPFIK
jgi:protein-S-isoprenylcysteine O-methyltransferase